MKMIVMVGLPGSGKSTIALNHYKDYVRVNQDELGSRDACVALCIKSIENGRDVIIDRCNTDIRQRRTWLNLAKFYGITDVECINIMTSPEESYKRACARKIHPTIKALTHNKIRAIINSFYKGYEQPTLKEGFSKITIWENT